MRAVVLAPLAAAALSLWGCTPALPEPDSAGARLYRERCNACHRLYAPNLLKADMWRVQVDRMQGEFARRGLAPLSDAERVTLLEYLQRHSG